jgi:hypothetical protein
MKYKFLLWLLLFASVCNAQIAAVVSAGSSNRNSGSPAEKTYVDVPAAPSFTSPATITDAVGSSLESGEISGASDILIDDNAIAGLFNNRLRPNAISSKRFKSAGSTRIFVGGDNVTTGMQVIAPLNGSDILSYYHIGIQGNSSTAQTGISGLNHLASVSGTTVLAEDVVIKDVEFAGCLINESTSGEKYISITLNFIRVFGYPDEGEGFYIGSTNKLSNFSTTDALVMNHCLSYNKGREGLQITSGLDAQISHITCRLSGVENIAGQNNMLQVHNYNGYIKKSIFHGGPHPMNLFTHGFLFEDCYFEWDADNPIYMGRLLDAAAFGASALAGNGQPVTFRRCIFAPTVNVTNLIRILETDCNIVFEDCIFSDRISNIILDDRAGSPTNTISNTGGSVVAAASIPSPTYKNFDPADEDNHGRVTSDYHYNLGLGAFSPDPE